LVETDIQIDIATEIMPKEMHITFIFFGQEQVRGSIYFEWFKKDYLKLLLKLPCLSIIIYLLNAIQ